MVLVVATVGGISLLSDTCAALCLSSCSLVALEGVDILSSFRPEPDNFVLSEAKACDNGLCDSEGDVPEFVVELVSLLLGYHLLKEPGVDSVGAPRALD